MEERRGNPTFGRVLVRNNFPASLSATALSSAAWSSPSVSSTPTQGRSHSF
jgi:hypothetical protein